VDSSECKRRLHELKFVTRMNQQYHQILQWRWAVADRIVRIMVAFIASASVCFGLLGLCYTYCNSYAIGASCCGLAVALILNVVPFAGKERFYADTFRRWSDLRQEIESLEVQVADVRSQTRVPKHIVDRVRVLTEKRNIVNASEPCPYGPVLDRCEEAQWEAIHGKGVRSQEDLDKREKRD
jgi:hypothetical protein